MSTKKKATEVAESKEEVTKAAEAEEAKKAEEATTKATEVAEEPRVIGSLKWGSEVHQKNGHLKIKAIRWPISKRELPEDIRKWLTNKGYGTNIYLKSKEELERRNVDLKMVDKLKKFISERYI